MDWSNERYVRLYTRDTTTWKLLDWRARCTLTLLIRKVDRSGVLDVGADGAEGLAAVIELPIDIVGPGIDQLIRRRTVEHNGTAYVLPNFIEAQEATMSDAARKRESREKRRDRARGPVTNRDQESQNVTVCPENRPTPPPSVTDSHSDPIRSYPSRAAPEPVRTAEAPASAARPALTRDQEQERIERDRWCTAKWEELNAARKRIAAKHGLGEVQHLHPQDKGRRDLAIRVRDGGEEAKRQVEHVLRVRIAEAEASQPPTVRWLSGAMFDLDGDQWRNALAMTPADAARPRGSRAALQPSKPARLADRPDDDSPPIPSWQRESAGAKP